MPLYTAEQLNAYDQGYLPNHLGISFTHVSTDMIKAEMPIQSFLMAANGFLHTGSVVTLADTTAGYGCIVNLPARASGFTTVELKSNHLGTAREGTVDCVAQPAHLGKTTQVWDAVVTHRETGKTLALFRCTQMILYPKA